MASLRQLIEEIVTQELEEVNAIGAGGVSATGGGPLGQNMSPAHNKMWSGDKPLKKRKVQEGNLADKMGLQRATDQVRRDVVGGSPVYMDRHDGNKEATKKVIQKVAKNLNRKPYSKKPPMMGLAEGVEWLIEMEAVLAEAKIDVALEAEKDPEMRAWLTQIKTANVPPKFVPWLIKQGRIKQSLWHGMGPAHDEVANMVDVLSKFEHLAQRNVLPSKDINTYSWNSLWDAVKAYENQPSAGQMKKAAKDDTTVYYKDADYLILEPTSMAASCHYGQGTKWCISATQSQNYFDSYQSQGARFLFIINRKTGDKDALAATTNGLEIYDSADAQKPDYYISEKYPKHIVDKVNEIFQAQYGYMPFIEYSLEGVLQNPDMLIYGEEVQDRFFRETPLSQLNVLEALGQKIVAGDIDPGESFSMLAKKVIEKLLNHAPALYATRIWAFLKTDPYQKYYMIGQQPVAKVLAFITAKNSGTGFPTTLFPVVLMANNFKRWSDINAQKPVEDPVGMFADVVHFGFDHSFGEVEDTFYKRASEWWKFAASPIGKATPNVREMVERVFAYAKSVNWNFVAAAQ